jgi:hypothetical protein
VARPRKNKSWEDDWGRFKELSVAAGEAYCQAHDLPYDRIEFICPRPEKELYDALVYVWNENAARGLFVKLPQDAEPNPEETAPGLESELENELEAAADVVPTAKEEE